MRKLMLIWLALPLLTGCMVGPDYQRPNLDIPSNWYKFTLPEANQLANTAWWEQLGDPVLSVLIKTALQNNLDLKLATERIEEYSARYSMSRADLFPQLGVQSGFTKQLSTEEGTNPIPRTTKNPTQAHSAALSASWEIDLWGKVRRANEAARAQILASEEARQAVIISLVSGTAAAYINLRDLDRQLEIAKDAADTRKQSAEIFKLRYQSGLISEMQLKQAESEYASVLASLPRIQKGIEQAENLINVLLGRHSGPVPRGKPISELHIIMPPAGIPSDVLARRPDIRQAEQQLIAANAQIGVAKAAHFPTISLTGLFGYASDQLSDLFTGPAKTWSYAVQIAAPIFAGGKISSGVRAAEAVQREALIQYQKVIEDSFRDVQDALVDQQRTREEFQAQKQQVEALRKYAELAKLRYDNGYSSYIEVLDAERNLFSAELQATQTAGNIFLAMISLHKALGGGWEVQLKQEGKIN